MLFGERGCDSWCASCRSTQQLGQLPPTLVRGRGVYTMTRPAEVLLMGSAFFKECSKVGLLRGLRHAFIVPGLAPIQPAGCQQCRVAVVARTLRYGAATVVALLRGPFTGVSCECQAARWIMWRQVFRLARAAWRSVYRLATHTGMITAHPFRLVSLRSCGLPQRAPENIRSRRPRR